MRQSQNIGNKSIGLSSLVVFLIFTQANLSFARPRPCVYVELDSEKHVNPFRLKLTYHIPPTGRGEPIKAPIAAGPVQEGAGLVFEHISADGTRTTLALPPEAWWFSKVETQEIKSSTVSMYFSISVLPAMLYRELPEIGIYHISYVHPWAEPEEDPNSLLFRSNTLTIACVTQQRSDQLHTKLRQNPELAFASYKFKNPSSARENPKYRSVPKIIDKAIEKGAKQDEVLLLLGSPDGVARATIGVQKTYGWDEEWYYETSAVGGYQVNFKNGCVAKKVFGGDSSDP